MFKVNEVLKHEASYGMTMSNYPTCHKTLKWCQTIKCKNIMHVTPTTTEEEAMLTF